MSGVINIEALQDLILDIRQEKVLLDADVASIYGVKTRDINKAVANNPEKFPSGYVFELTRAEKNELVKKFHRFVKLKHSTVNPKSFTEKGLYMLATNLKSQQATQTTLSIIETFSKIRELSRTVSELSTLEDKKDQQSLMQRSGELIAEILDDDLQTSEAETVIELNFAVLKFKHTVKKKK
ncbi:MAG: ORF6N domain-containing protein [Ghiorsea sp.]|nr:ORF6N domain-containing protein [Ghiorsea sp.]